MIARIGIIACSAEGAALCYRTICTKAPALLGEHAHPEVAMHSHSLAEYVACLDAGDLRGVADLMLSSAAKLATIGADFLICPDNTIHQALHLVTPLSPLPWLHIAEVVADEAAARGFQRVGVMGTRYLVNSPVYPDALRMRSIECLRSSAADAAETHRIIMRELVYGDAPRQSRAALQRIANTFAQRGADAVVLACTELPLVLDERNAGLPILDSTRLLAQAAIQRAITATI